MSSARIGAAVVSASMAIVATDAMAFVASRSDAPIRIERVEGVGDELAMKVNAAVGKRDVRLAVSQAFTALAASFGDEDSTLVAKYFPDSEAMLAQVTTPGADFTNGAGGCYSNCHSACHGACHVACHGSRGWR